MADEDQKTSTVSTETEAPNNVTDSEDSKDLEVPPAGTAGASDDDSQDEGSEDGKSSDDEGEGSTPNKKDENRSAYKIRRLVSDNPRMQLLRERLQGWVDDTEDPRESKDRQRDVDDYIRDAAQAQADIERDNEQVLSEIPEFNPESDTFKPQLRQRMLAQYARDMLIEDQNGAKDANGNPIIVGYRMRLIDYAREKAEDYGFESKKPSSGKQPAPKKSSKQAKAKMDAAADTPSGASAASGKNKDDEDPFLKGFDDPYGRHTPTNAHTWSEK